MIDILARHSSIPRIVIVTVMLIAAVVTALWTRNVAGYVLLGTVTALFVDVGGYDLIGIGVVHGWWRRWGLLDGHMLNPYLLIVPQIGEVLAYLLPAAFIWWCVTLPQRLTRRCS